MWVSRQNERDAISAISQIIVDREFMLLGGLLISPISPRSSWTTFTSCSAESAPRINISAGNVSIMCNMSASSMGVCLHLSISFCALD